jgi:hypothetical protein
MDGEIHPQVRLVVQPYGSRLPLVFPLELVATIMAFLTGDTGVATSLGLVRHGRG